MRFIYFSFSILLSFLLFSCDSKGNTIAQVGFEPSKSEFSAYFYPEYKSPRIYIFRDSLVPLIEQYHRVYAKNIMDYRHNILEVYRTDGSYSETYVYKLNDSLTLMEHTVLDRNKNKESAQILRSALIPLSKKKSAYFVSRFKGPQDSTMMLAEIHRAYWKGPIKMNIMGKTTDVIIMNDTLRQTMFNPFTKQEKVMNVLLRTLFAKNLGMVGYYTDNKELNMQLDRIVSEKEWINLMKK